MNSNEIGYKYSVGYEYSGVATIREAITRAVIEALVVNTWVI